MNTKRKTPCIEIHCPTCASFCKGNNALQRRILPYCRQDVKQPGNEEFCLEWRPRKAVVENAVMKAVKGA